MRLLTIAFVSSAEFLSHYREREGAGALFYRSRAELEPHEAVLMEISFPGLPNRALCRGSVAKTTPGKGAWVAFSKKDRTTRDFLLGIARGELMVTPAVNRSFDRFPVELPVDCTVELGADDSTERIVSRTVDVGAGGVFIRSLAPPPVGTHVKLTLGPGPDDSFVTVTLEGDVAWTRDVENGGKGFGVRFHNKSEMDARLLRTLLRRASETGKVGFAN